MLVTVRPVLMSPRCHDRPTRDPAPPPSLELARWKNQNQDNNTPEALPPVMPFPVWWYTRTC